MVLGVGLSATPADAHGVNVSVGVGIPFPPVVFTSEPQLVALPGTYVYAAPEYPDVEVYFVDGWWWRPWEGHWYRSHYYDRDWVSYNSTPYFYRSIPRDWRTQYSRNEWGGRPWNHEAVSYNDVQRNWSSWKREGRWNTNRVVETRPVSNEVRTGTQSERIERGTRNHEYRGAPAHTPKVNEASRPVSTHYNTKETSRPAATHYKAEKAQTTSRPAHVESHGASHTMSAPSTHMQSHGGGNRPSGAQMQSHGGATHTMSAPSAHQSHGGATHTMSAPSAHQSHGGGGGHSQPQASGNQGHGHSK
jgi:hypothetical protein